MNHINRPYGMAAKLISRIRRLTFKGSASYWNNRYKSGGDSGVGSYTKFADFKAKVLNDFVAASDIHSVIEFGSGDGNQVSLANYKQYLGIDVSEEAIQLCKERFKDDKTKVFMTLNDYNGEIGDLALSLDVIYHLVEDSVYEKYMSTLFSAARKYVIVYSSNNESVVNLACHVRHRTFTNWVALNAPSWALALHIPNKYPYTGDSNTGSFADFYIFHNNNHQGISNFGDYS